jgi:hypothetical protein
MSDSGRLGPAATESANSAPTVPGAVASVEGAWDFETKASSDGAEESQSFSGFERFHSWKASPFFPFELPPKEKPFNFVLGAAALEDSRDAFAVVASGARPTNESIVVSMARSTD